MFGTALKAVSRPQRLRLAVLQWRRTRHVLSAVWRLATGRHRSVRPLGRRRLSFRRGRGNGLRRPVPAASRRRPARSSSRGVVLCPLPVAVMPAARAIAVTSSPHGGETRFPSAILPAISSLRLSSPRLSAVFPGDRRLSPAHSAQPCRAARAAGFPPLRRGPPPGSLVVAGQGPATGRTPGGGRCSGQEIMIFNSLNYCLVLLHRFLDRG